MSRYTSFQRDMAGYDRVYRGRPLDPRQYDENLPEKYYNRDMIRPLDITSLPTLIEDNSSANNGKVNPRLLVCSTIYSSFFFF